MTSEKRLAANRANAKKSTGPRTPEGKARSRRNGLKHGLTGAGIVLAGEDGPAVVERIEAWSADLGPRDHVEGWLVSRAATASVRLDRCVRRECANLAVLVQVAADDWDEKQQAAARSFASNLVKDPAASFERLGWSVAGLDWLLGQWARLEAQVRRQGWLPLPNLVYALNLTGRAGIPSAAEGSTASELWGMGLGAMEELPLPAVEAFYGLKPAEGATIEERDAAANAAVPEGTLGPDGLLGCIAAEVARLRERRAMVWERFDGPARASVLDRARFDASPDAVLMKRYETSATTDLHRALNQFLKVRHEEFESGGDAQHEPIEAADALISLGDLDSGGSLTTLVDKPPVPADGLTILVRHPAMPSESICSTIGSVPGGTGGLSTNVFSQPRPTNVPSSEVTDSLSTNLPSQPRSTDEPSDELDTLSQPTTTMVAQDEPTKTPELIRGQQYPAIADLLAALASTLLLLLLVLSNLVVSPSTIPTTGRPGFRVPSIGTTVVLADTLMASRNSIARMAFEDLGELGKFGPSIVLAQNHQLAQDEKLRRNPALTLKGSIGTMPSDPVAPFERPEIRRTSP